MNNTAFQVWLHMQLEPDTTIIGGGPVKHKREPIDPAFFKKYADNNLLLTLREQEEREDNYLRSHGVPLKNQ